MTAARAPRVSVIIPAYNEAHRIANTIRAIEVGFTRGQASAEIVVVDDGSTDGTALAAGRAGGCARVLRNTENRGKGYSVTRGVLAASGDIVVFTDADLAVGADQFERLLRPFEAGAAVAIASRRHPESRILVPQPRARVAMGVLFNTLVRAALLPGLTDTQCGLKGFSRAAARDVFSRVRVSGWCFDVEALTIAKVRGYRIAEVPVDWSDSGETKLKPLQTTWQIARDITTIFWRRRLGLYERE